MPCEDLTGYKTGPGGTCIEICGDGLNLGTYECDDGNRRDGDGCDQNCKVEDGYTCETNSALKDECYTISGPS